MAKIFTCNRYPFIEAGEEGEAIARRITRIRLQTWTI